MDELLNVSLWGGLLLASLRQATPLLWAAHGEIWSQRSGVLNVGIEGIMLLGALAGFFGAYYTGDRAWVGLLVSASTGIAAGALLSGLTTFLGVDQVVAGIAFNMASLGLTSFAYQRLLSGSMVPPSVSGLPSWAGMDIMVPLSILGAPVSWFLLRRSVPGLAVRAVGEHPVAAESAGIQVLRVRFVCSTLSGLTAALAGACLSLGQLHMFLENMTAGRGFIVLAIVVFSGWNPWKALGLCILFGMADGLQLRLQALRIAIPRDILMMAPYLLCLLVLSMKTQRVKQPSHLAVPYRREMEGS